MPVLLGESSPRRLDSQRFNEHEERERIQTQQSPQLKCRARTASQEAAAEPPHRRRKDSRHLPPTPTPHAGRPVPVRFSAEARLTREAPRGLLSPLLIDPAQPSPALIDSLQLQGQRFPSQRATGRARQHSRGAGRPGREQSGGGTGPAPGRGSGQLAGPSTLLLKGDCWNGGLRRGWKDALPPRPPPAYVLWAPRKTSKGPHSQPDPEAVLTVRGWEQEGLPLGVPKKPSERRRSPR